jgi:hypothetical protein
MQRLGLYRLENRIADDGATTYAGVDESSQKRVFVHLIPENGKHQTIAALTERMRAGSKEVLDLRMESGQVYAVTVVIPEFVSFAEWLPQKEAAGANSWPLPTADTVDAEIAAFAFLDPPERAAPPRENVDEVARIFARPTSATEMRGHRESIHVPKQAYAPQAPRGPSPYTEVIESRRKAPVAPSPEVKQSASAPSPDPEIAKRLLRLEASLTMWKAVTIGCCIAVAFSLILTLILLSRGR